MGMGRTFSGNLTWGVQSYIGGRGQGFSTERIRWFEVGKGGETQKGTEPIIDRRHSDEGGDLDHEKGNLGVEKERGYKREGQGSLSLNLGKVRAGKGGSEIRSMDRVTEKREEGEGREKRISRVVKDGGLQDSVRKCRRVKDGLGKAKD